MVASDGRVVGVLARRYGTELALRARRGVVITTGGFIYDDPMVARFVPDLCGNAKVGTDGDDGSGIRLARAAGAAVRHMGAGQVAPTIAPALLARSVLVDGGGHRFINEDTYPGRIGQVALFHHGARAFAILDEQGYESVPEKERMGQVPEHVAASPEELAADIGISPEVLGTTLRSYNEAAASRQDPQFHKAARWLQPLCPPFGAIDLRSPGRQAPAGLTEAGTGFGVFTLGGLRTDLAGRVLAGDGSAIPGLYAAGRATSGLHGWGYISGTSLGDGTFFGRRAGRTASSVTGSRR